MKEKIAAALGMSNVRGCYSHIVHSITFVFV